MVIYKMTLECAEQGWQAHANGDAQHAKSDKYVRMGKMQMLNDLACNFACLSVFAKGSQVAPQKSLCMKVLMLIWSAAC